MKILIIGSKGFIGSHCVNYFSKTQDVWECDVVMDYDKPKYFFVEAIDSNFQELFEKQQFDVCINCSGAANVPFSLEKPLNDYQLNTVNVFKILDSIRRFNPSCKFINLSSAAVYGNPDRLPIDTDNSLSPVSPYGYHKVMAEMICREFSTFWQIGTCCIRIFSAYGPGLKKQLLWDISQKLKADGALNLFGTGNETRDFIYIDDLVRLIDIAIRNSDFKADVLLAASGKEISIREVAETMVDLLAPGRDIKFSNTNRKGDPLNWVADISAAKALGFTPQTDIKTGITEYVKWLKGNGLA